MKLIADSIPNLKDLFTCNPADNRSCPNLISRDPTFIFRTLGDFLIGLINIIFYIAVFLTFYYLVWGAFAYIMAQGKKEDLAKARARITWALIGLIVIFLSFAVAKYGAIIFKPTKGGLPF